MRRGVRAAPRGGLRGSQEAPDATRETLARVCGGRAKYLTERSAERSGAERSGAAAVSRASIGGTRGGGAIGAWPPSVRACVLVTHELHCGRAGGHTQLSLVALIFSIIFKSLCVFQ